VFQQDSVRAECRPRRACATVELLRQETPNVFRPNLWPPNSPDLSPVDYEIWAVMQHRVYHRQIHSVDELKRRLIDVWCGHKQSIFDEATDQWRGRFERVSILKEDISNTACELTVLILSISVTFSVTCLTVCIFNYEIMPATLANTFLFILQGSVLWGMMVYFRIRLVTVNFCLQQWKID